MTDSAPASRQAEFRHLTDDTGPLGPAPAGGRIILSECGGGYFPIPPAAVSLKYVLDGEEHYETARGTAVIRSGQFAVVGPSIPLTAVLPRSDRTIGLCVYLPETFIRPTPIDGGAEFGVFRSKHGLGSMLEQVASRLVHRPQLDSAAIGELLNRMRLELNCLAHSGVPFPDNLHATKKSTRDELARRLKRARDYLHMHAGKSVTLVELGRASGISPFHLARTFREAFGTGPGAYHLELRLALAARLLRDGRTCSDVAERLGYSEPGAFGRAFKQRYGVTPGDYGGYGQAN